MGVRKRVAIIGAGCSGITAIKCCLDEDLEPMCIERTDHIGGLWYYTKESTDGQPCVMKSTIINTSKEMMCYSVFPIPKEFANYMHNTKVVEYFNQYVNHFGLKKYIRFKTQVSSVKRSPDYEDTGKWCLEIKDLTTNTETTETYDAVLLCSGHHADKNIPTFEGQESFEGQIVHTHDYKSHEGLEDKGVVVIGIGNSGADVAAELGKVSKQMCIERTDHIGGLWYYTKESTDGQPCVMKSTIINTSKEMMCYSVFPIPKEFANYMHNTKVVEYFNQYVNHFGLKKYIRFKTQVSSVKRSPDYEDTGKWCLEIKDLTTNTETTETYDAVLLCSGHHADKNIPTFEGQESFEGQIVHTHDYKSHEGLEDKGVVVIGIGNSGADVAAELGKVSKQTYLVTRQGTWIFNRVADHGLPIDFVITTRFIAVLRDLIPASIVNWATEKDVNKRFDHTLYGLRPKHRILNAHPTVSDDLPNRIIAGVVVIKPNVKRILPTSVEFENGTVAEDIDIIVLATGYKFGFPFLEKGIIDVHENKANLYKYVFPPHLKHPTLATIGFIQPWGAIMPISETQCRWAAKVFKGETKLPSNADMWVDVKKKADDMEKRYVKSTRHTIQVDYVQYMDELAEQIQCKPDFWKLMRSDPKLAWRVMFDPCTPYQYRLQGPNSWSGARDAIMTMWERAFYPLQTRKAEEPPSMQSAFLFFLGSVLIAILLYFVML